MKLWLPFLITFLFFAPYTTQGFAQQLGDDKPASPSGVLDGTKNQGGKFKYEGYMAVSPYKGTPVRKAGMKVDFNQTVRLIPQPVSCEHFTSALLTHLLHYRGKAIRRLFL